MRKNRGFTLVELLIVIALIGVLAGAIVATLNPIEQVNKARDARYENEASELLGAIERYYASQLKFPWVTYYHNNDDNTWTNNTEFMRDARDAAVGVCGDGSNGDTANDPGVAKQFNCATDNVGVLLGGGGVPGELKTSFINKAQFKNDAAEDDRMYVIKPENDDSVYVCFIPKSQTRRSDISELKDIYNNSDNELQPPGNCSFGEDSNDTWDSLETGACVVCLPD